MPTVTQFYQLKKTQPELDFVDVELNTDNPLFIDPFAVSQRLDAWSQAAHHTIVGFFQLIVDAIRAGDRDAALRMLQFLREPNETRLGLSRKQPQGAGIGSFQADQLVTALEQSSAVQSGSLASLEECELMVEGISFDKISDLATNLIRVQLAQYTKDQCELHGIPIQAAPLPPAYDLTQNDWQSRYFLLPVPDGKPLVLVPKLAARYRFSYNHGAFYRHYVLNFLQQEHLNAGTALVRTFRNGKRRVFKKDVAEIFPCTKENLARFSRDHPEVLRVYRERLAHAERRNAGIVTDVDEESALARALREALDAIPAGSADASSFHSLMLGILELLLFPALTTPVKELEIHDGRKRIDIVMSNAALEGIFYLLPTVRRIFCPYVMIECKNYVNDVANPELDQLIGRFGNTRSRFGILCCRHFDDRARFLKRCQDTYSDGHGLIIGLADDHITQLLDRIIAGDRRSLDAALTAYVDEVMRI